MIDFIHPDPLEVFLEHTYPCWETLYSSAFCLAGNREDAEDLVETTYLRAFRSFNAFRRSQPSEPVSSTRIRLWMFRHLHEVYFDWLLKRAKAADPFTEGRH